MRSLVLLVLVACTPGVYGSMSHRSNVNPAPPVAPARLDLDASEVFVDGEGLGGDASGDDIRNAVGQALQEYLGNGAPNAPPARFRLVARTSVSGAAIMWLVPCFMYFIVIGCPVNIQSAHVDLTLQVGQRTYTGAGDSRTVGGLYYNHNTRGALGRAAAEALEQIFDNARLK